MGRIVARPDRKDAISLHEWRAKRQKIEFLQGEVKRRKLDLNPLYYGMPDLHFPQNFHMGELNLETLDIDREPLEQQETEEEWKVRQDRALYELVTQRLSIIKDDKIINIRLMPKMVRLLADLFYGRISKVILWANRGGGKCLGSGTPVIMADGSIRPVEEIRTGDRLMGPDGKARTVQGTTSGRSPLYRITPVKGESWVCNDKHVLTLVKHGHQNGGGTVIDIPVEEFLAKNKTFQESYKQFSVGIDEFEPSDYRPLDIDPYFLGVWFGDGTKYVKTLTDGSRALAWVVVTKADPEIKKLCESTASEWGLKVTAKTNSSGCPSYSIVNDHGQGNSLLDVMRETLGPDLRVPDAILRGSRDVRLAFLAGFLDTDSELHHNGYVITQKREDWSRAVWRLARSLGFMAVIKPVGGTYHQVSIYGDTDRIPLRIPRKRATSRKQRKTATRTGIKIDPIGEGDYYGFMLDGDGRFLLGDFTVTHNSLLASVFIWLNLVYNKRSCINMGGAGNQARRVYDYTIQFWSNFPGMKEGYLTREPLLQRTELRNGSRLICATSGTTAIGEHLPVFTADEACTDRPGADDALLRAMQGALSEENHSIFLLSTFHLPVGFFADMWDSAEEQGFTRVRWNCILPDTWMLTGDGLRQARDVRAGNLVMTETGEFKPVSKAWSQISNKDAVLITPYGWTEGFRVTADHKMLVSRGQDEVWVEARDIETTDLLVFPTPKKGKAPLPIDLGDQSLEWTPDFCRWLGYLLGDGWVDKRTVGVSFGVEKDDSYQTDYIRIVGSLFSRKVTVDKDPSNRRGRFGHKVLTAWLRKNFYRGRDKHVPLDMLLGLPEEHLREFLVGLMRTDGRVTLQGSASIPVAKFTQVNSSIAQSFFVVAARLGLHASMERRKQTTTTIEGRAVSGRDWWMIRFESLGTEALMSWMGMAPPVRKKRNREQWSRQNGRFLTPIRKLSREPYYGPVYDFAVEDVHSFSLPWAVAHNCYDSMAACEEGLEEATPEDPKARNFCFHKCPLTRVEDTHDEFGRVNGKQWIGCQGQARHSSGWQTRKTVIEEMNLNRGTRIFRTEHECSRPNREGQIYNRALIEKCVVESVTLRDDKPFIAGIDWGLTECAMVLLAEWTEENPDDPDWPREGLCVVDVVYMSGRLVDAVVEQIERWHKEFTTPDLPAGPTIHVRADGSHPYNNNELANYGYLVKPVHGDKKYMGTDNTARWLGSGFLRILSGMDLFVTQLHNLRRNIVTGKQVKKNVKGEEGDHGPDALRFALMGYDYVKWMTRKRKQREAAENKKVREIRKRSLGFRKNLDRLLR